jgi:hypothetical protein
MNNSPRHFSCSAEFPIRGIGPETRAWSTPSQRLPKSTKMMRSSLVNVADFSVIFDDFSLKLLKNRDIIISASDTRVDIHPSQSLLALNVKKFLCFYSTERIDIAFCRFFSRVAAIPTNRRALHVLLSLSSTSILFFSLHIPS